MDVRKLGLLWKEEKRIVFGKRKSFRSDNTKLTCFYFLLLFQNTSHNFFKMIPFLLIIQQKKTVLILGALETFYFADFFNTTEKSFPFVTLLCLSHERKFYLKCSAITLLSFFSFFIFFFFFFSFPIIFHQWYFFFW